jgi:hypothetical protein
MRDQRSHVGQARMRGPRRRLVIVRAQHSDQATHLGKRLPTGLLDSEQGVALFLLLGRQQPANR